MITESDLRWRGNEIVLKRTGARVGQIVPGRKKSATYRIFVGDQFAVCHDIASAHARATEMVLAYLNKGENLK